MIGQWLNPCRRTGLPPRIASGWSPPAVAGRSVRPIAAAAAEIPPKKVRLDWSLRMGLPQGRWSEDETSVVRRGSPDPAVGRTEGLPTAGTRGDLRSVQWQGPETSPQRNVAGSAP